MILAFSIEDLPLEAVSVLTLLLISFIGWVKGKFFDRDAEPPPVDEDPMREVIWRRQIGEEEFDWEPPRAEPEYRPAPPPVPSPAPGTSTPPVVPEVSEKAERLAASFERNTGRSRGSRPHRRKIDALLHSPSAARQAILLTEILGPPVSLRNNDRT